MNDRIKSANYIAWTALVISVIAILLSILSFAMPIDQDDNNETENAWIVARQELTQARDDFAEDRDFEAARDQVNQTRTELRDNFSNADSEARQQWEEVDTELADLMQDIEEMSDETLTSFDRALARLRQSLRD